ncbi:DUF1398 domain-containing protein [Ancylobacter terrae]|uniref:DUF1398 domain-containing protein n=1 Tax=Ancylobacter sp. sgz301288 TaxID=3342077 RepID=UPI00385A7494
MPPDTHAVIARCNAASHDGTMSFPQIVGALGAAGVESYVCDLRRATKTYYLPSGESLELPAGKPYAVAERFDEAGVAAAIREAQANGPGYSYDGFCVRIAAAGCAGYIVSLLGRRAVYLGRTGESHVELFPGT